ncbi:MAG: DUF4105 domain-containing protein [Bdellovibrionales bacterium]|nr:DUF4105 domain-containing protein [Bdellovibrionales bacterium]
MQMKLNNKFALAFVGLALSLCSLTALAMDTEPCPLMKAGKYKGQCIDTSGKRAVKIVSQSADSITVLNFRKAGVFYKAILPLNEIGSLSYEVVDLNAKPVNFLSLINISHTEMRFKLKPGSVIKLYPNDEHDGGAPIETETDVMVSMNYMAPKGVPYDPVKGFNEDLYASVLQIFSTQDEVKKRFTENKFNVYEVDLNVTPDQAGSILREAMMVSHRIQYGVAYDTWSSNCTTFLFDILDSGLHVKDQKPYRFSPLIANDTGLKPALKALVKRNLVSTSTKVELLNAEFGYGVFPSNSNRYFNTWIGKSLDSH